MSRDRECSPPFSLLRDVTRHALRAFEEEFKREMYRRHGPETRRMDHLWPKIVGLVGDLIDERVEKSDFRSLYEPVALLQERPDLLFGAEREENPLLLELKPGKLAGYIHKNLRLALREALDFEKIALLAHKRALQKGY